VDKMPLKLDEKTMLLQSKFTAMSWVSVIS